ncbi:MAG: hypothetical protein RL299_204 [Pseudomonadota bacterium]|jgi:hypothetical protein
MSKVVKKIGRTVKKVVKGVGTAVKKFAKSKIGKLVIIAAATYFGVPMLAGALGGASAGVGLAGTVSGAFSGAGAGLAQAWGGLTGAVGALGSGSLSGAGSALAGGFSPSAAYGAGGGILSSGGAAAVGNVGAAMNGPEMAAGAAEAGSSPSWLAELSGKFPDGMKLANASTQPQGGGGGILDSILNSKAAPALIQAGSSMIGSIGQQKMDQERLKEAEAAAQRMRDEERANRNANMGVLFASQSDPGEGYYKKSSFVPRFST